MIANAPLKKPKVLIVTYNFLPFFRSYGGVARCANLYLLLKHKGCEVKVVSADGVHFSWFGKEDLIDAKNIVYVPSLVNRIHGSIRSTKTAAEKASRTGSFTRFFSFLSRTAHKLLVPDYSVTDSRKFRKVVSSLVENEGYSNIVISTPKHGVSIIAPALKRRFGERVNLILDYRDSWNTSAIFEPRNRLLRAISHAMEKRILKSIDHLTYVSPSVPGSIEKKLGLRPPSTMIMNGFEGERSKPKQVIRESGRKKLLYFGAATDRPESYRDVSNLIRICESNDSLSLDIYGDLELVRHDLGALRNVRYNGTVTPDESGRVFSAYDWGIVLHTDPFSAAEVIPGKVFDYIQHSKPILCVTPTHAEVSKLIKREKIGISVEPDLASLTDCIDALFDEHLIHEITERYKRDDFDQFSRRSQLERFMELFR